jgi:hypothetical protein
LVPRSFSKICCQSLGGELGRADAEHANLGRCSMSTVSAILRRVIVSSRLRRSSPVI